MLISREREKLLNAIIYLAEHTTRCGKTKLFKLLYLLDFEHFKLTGRSVTGLRYYAWQMGPVPVSVEAEFAEPARDFQQAVQVVSEGEFDYRRLQVKPKRKFDASHFSKRELKLLEEIAARYRNKTAKQMVEVTHESNGPWERVWQGGAGQNQEIAYELALSGSDSAGVLDAAREYEALRNHYATTA